MRSTQAAPADLEGALDAMGLRLFRSNDDEVTCWCPGHRKKLGREDNDPSWSVNRTTGLHNCYSCGYGGTFIDLVMDELFPNNVFAAARWMRQFGVNLARATDLITEWDSRHDDDLEPQVLLPETQLAMYADVPDWALEARQINREAVDHYGVRWEEKGSAWIIPVRTPTGDLIGWQQKWQNKRRFMNLPPDMPKSQCLFGLEQFPVGEPAVLLESPLDVLRLYTADFEGGVSTYGAEWSTRQMNLLRLLTDELVVALDDDGPGRKAAEEIRSGRFDGGKLVVPSYRRSFKELRFFDYGRTGEKDLGGMSDDQIVRGLYEAQGVITAVLDPKTKEQATRAVRRRTTPVQRSALRGRAPRQGNVQNALPAGVAKRRAQSTNAGRADPRSGRPAGA